MRSVQSSQDHSPAECRSPDFLPHITNLADRLREIDEDDDLFGVEGSFLDPRRRPAGEVPPEGFAAGARPSDPPSVAAALPRRKRRSQWAVAGLCLGLAVAAVTGLTVAGDKVSPLLTDTVAMLDLAPVLDPVATPVAATKADMTASPPIEIVPPSPEAVISVPTEITVEPTKEARLAIAVDPSDGVPPRSVVAIRDLPDGSSLSAGRPHGPRGWTLLPDELGDVRVVVPEGATGSTVLRLELIDATGAVTSTAETRLTVVPSPKPSPVVRPEEVMRAQSLIEHGRKMVEVGYIAGARAYFQRAAEAGSPEAAAALAATYDPEALKAMHAHGIKPDAAQAAFWYARAEELGEMAKTN